MKKSFKFLNAVIAAAALGLATTTLQARCLTPDSGQTGCGASGWTFTSNGVEYYGHASWVAISCPGNNAPQSVRIAKVHYLNGNNWSSVQDFTTNSIDEAVLCEDICSAGSLDTVSCTMSVTHPGGASSANGDLY